MASWALVSVAVIGSLLATHTLTLPEPPRDEALRAAVAASRSPEERGRWLMLHVLYSRCRCSRQVIEHLERRGVRADAAERLVLVGQNDELASRARAAGFAVEPLEPNQLLARYRMSAAPALVIAAPDGALRYAGGYSERKQGPVIEDEHILARVLAGEQASALPLFGCAVSQQLRSLLDPLGLKSLGVGEF